MKQNIFFTADHHFGHTNIIKFSERPFESLEHMNEELIKRWNEKVGVNDIVYHLGDVSLGKPDFTKETLDRLNGSIHLIKGNHEGSTLTYPKRFDSIRDYHELRIDEPEIKKANRKSFFSITRCELGMAHIEERGNSTGTGMFGDIWKRVPMPKNGILRNVDAFYKREGEVGYSTNGYLVIEDLIRRNEKVDKVMLFTDTQLWNSNLTNDSFEYSWNRYKKINPNAKLYIFDLAGYGKQPLDVRKNDAYLIAGWSDKIFDVLNALEDRKSAVEMIKKVVL